MRPSLSSLFKISLLASFIIYFSCKKETENKPNPNPVDTTKPVNKDSLRVDSIFNMANKLAKDDSQIGTEIDDILGFQDEIMTRGSVNFGRVAFKHELCTEVTVVPKTDSTLGSVTLDFGNGCMGYDDRFRKGKIKWTYSKRLHQKTAILTTTFENYLVKRFNNFDSIAYNNNSTIVTTHVDSNLNGMTLQRQINMTLKFSDGKSISFQGQNDIQARVGLISEKGDNIYVLKQGTSFTGNDRNGTPYSKKAITDITRRGDCSYYNNYRPISGKELFVIGNTSFTIDYGDRTSCDGEISIAIDGKVKKFDW